MKSHPTSLGRNRFSAFLVLLFAGLSPFLHAQDSADLAAEIQAMKSQIEALEARLAAAEAEAATPAPVHSAVGEVEASEKNPFPYAPPVQDGWWQRTQLGGYGEMHLNLGDVEEIDFHRWVLFLNHDFNDRVRLVSELELEHSLAGEGKNGEVELEQAYVEFDLGNDFWLKTGLFLIPVGILNETHEPNTFFGTERNTIESEIIPTTWWEGGAALTKNFDSGFSFDLAAHSALDVPESGSSAYRIRSGRQKVSEAAAEEAAFTLRGKYTGIPGLELSSSVQHQTDITQGFSENNSAWLVEAHADWQVGPFGLRVLGANWSIDGATPELLGLDEQWGYYVEPSYVFTTGLGDFGVFGRWGQFDAAAGDLDFIDVGVNYWPLESVVLKADYRRVDGDEEEDTINFGVGYVF